MRRGLPKGALFGAADTTCSFIHFLDVSIEVFFLTDVLTNFVTAVETEIGIERSPKVIAVAYSKRWMLLDRALDGTVPC